MFLPIGWTKKLNKKINVSCKISSLGIALGKRGVGDYVRKINTSRNSNTFASNEMG